MQTNPAGFDAPESIPDSPWSRSDYLHTKSAIPNRPPRHPTAVFGAARWASVDDVAPFLSEPLDDRHVTRLREMSIVIEGRDRDLEPRYLVDFRVSDEVRSQHLLIVGPTGSGKTTCFHWPLLAEDVRDTQRTVIAVDVKGEMHGTLAAMTKRFRRKKPKVINFADAARSLGWCVVNRDLTPNEAFEIAYGYCHAAEIRASSHDSIYFLNNSIQLLAGLLLALARDPNERPCIARVREIVLLPHKAFLAWLKEHGSIAELASFQSFLDTGSHNAATVLSDLTMRLAAFMDENLQATTSHDEFRFASLIDDPQVVLIEIGEANIEELRPLLNVFFTHAFNTFLRLADRYPKSRLPRPVCFHFDEFASALGKIPDFEKRANTLRSRNVQIVASVQSIGQIRHVYDSAANVVLAAFRTKVFFPGVERADAEYASQLSGVTTVANVTSELCAGEGALIMAKQNVSAAARSLLLPDEIASPPVHFALGGLVTWFLPGVPPFQAWMRPCYEQDELGPFFRRDPEDRRTGSTPLRRTPLRYSKDAPPAVAAVAQPVEEVGFTDTRGWNDSRCWELVNELRARCGWEQTTGSARKWWTDFEGESKTNPRVVIRVLEELVKRKATITEFFLAFVYSQTANIQANLHYLDYTRLKRANDPKKSNESGGAA